MITRRAISPEVAYEVAALVGVPKREADELTRLDIRARGAGFVEVRGHHVPRRVRVWRAITGRKG